MHSKVYQIHNRVHSISGNVKFAPSNGTKLLLCTGLAALELLHSLLLSMIAPIHKTTRIIALIVSFSAIRLSFVRFKRCSSIFSTVLNRTVLGLNGRTDHHSMSETHFK